MPVEHIYFQRFRKSFDKYCDKYQVGYRDSPKHLLCQQPEVKALLENQYKKQKHKYRFEITQLIK